MKRAGTVMASISFLEKSQGFQAEVKIKERHHIVLIATNTAVGPVAAIYDAKTNKWWNSRQWAEDIDDAKAKAEATARNWYKYLGATDSFPRLVWTETISHPRSDVLM
jgi:hypothetical protein